ncbi:MAG: NAD(P)/FAD-dependent oxidoreductase [Firmicutes bacterium]|nr:NAD(P)/FAD-dependent oxidoreductase [Bacillota bacterium]
MKNYVIIGNGIAAVNCIEGIRSRDTDGTITVISEEKHPTYCRPLISYYLEGRTDLERIRYRDKDFYDRMGCEVLCGRRAVRIIPEEKKVELDGGDLLPYDSLCAALGSHPFVPKLEGLEKVRKKFSFTTLDDALALEKAVSGKSRVLIIGAGMIGLKCAECLADRVEKVTVCDLADHILPTFLDRECAAYMQKRMEEHGVKFALSDSVVSFEAKKAHIKSGAELYFDVLVLAIGARANASIVKDAGGAGERGIAVDGSMRTSIPEIYAAGDCVESTDVSCGDRRLLSNLPNAAMQGYTAGVNMAGGSAVFDNAVMMNSISFFGLHSMTAGTYAGELYEEKTESSVKRLYTEGDLLKGFVLIGCSDRAGIYTSMIRNRTPLSSVDFEMMKKAATTAAFSHAAREKMFGGMV